MNTRVYRLSVSIIIIVLQWKPKDCRPSVLQALIQRHDFHHRAFKKFVAQNKPFEYQVADKLFSYAGFVRYVYTCTYVCENILMVR